MPSRDPPSKAEIVEEMHLRQEILEGQRIAEESGETEPPARRFRVILGYKEL